MKYVLKTTFLRDSSSLFLFLLLLRWLWYSDGGSGENSIDRV